MENMKRYAIYYLPEAGGFSDAAASWLGWDLLLGRPKPQPEFDMPRPLHELTAAPRKYGFHATIKPPFRMVEGATFADLAQAVASLTSRLRSIALPGLQIVNLDGFLALIPQGYSAELQILAAEVVRSLEPFRAALTLAETARRRPQTLTPSQRNLLQIYGYPYVMQEFRFHRTLSGPLTETEFPLVRTAALAHFLPELPQPFVLGSLCLCGEDGAGRFHLLHRSALNP